MYFEYLVAEIDVYNNRFRTEAEVSPIPVPVFSCIVTCWKLGDVLSIVSVGSSMTALLLVQARAHRVQSLASESFPAVAAIRRLAAQVEQSCYA